ncbi:MAG: DUF2069 domain-containing protein [Rhodocyclaceae bacterium]|nr:DUF2069 domain-containing protein [Rhodocyclaceae bacterium]
MNPRLITLIGSASLIGLIFLCLAWELWLAPLRPEGSTLALKALPLLLPLFGVLRGKRYTYQWSSMLILAYLAEGLVRSYSDHGSGRLIAAVEIALSMIFFVSAMAYARATAPSAISKQGEAT